MARPSCLRAVLFLALASASTTGCLTVDENGIDLEARVPYESSIRDIDSFAWQGEALDVDVEQGFVEVVGDPDATELTVTADAMTWADYGDTESAHAINEAILATAAVTVSNGVVHVRCGTVEDDVGSAQAYATQCNMRVVVPAWPGATHAVSVHTGLGDAFLQRLATSATGQIHLDVAGAVEAWDLHGNVVSRAGSNDIEVTPHLGGNVDAQALVALAAGIGTDKGPNDAKDVTGTVLHLPATFGAQSLYMWSNEGVVLTADFPDLSGASQSRIGLDPAASIRATADWGHVQLLALQSFSSRSRTSSLGPIVTKP